MTAISALGQFAGLTPNPAKADATNTVSSNLTASASNQVDQIVTNAPPKPRSLNLPPARLVPAGFSNTNEEARPAIGTIILPTGVPDPLEGVNRFMWDLNLGIMKGFVKPTALVYRKVVIRSFRRGISNFGRNALYPGRLVNNLFQQKWDGAKEETDRFFCNTLLGIGGFFDPATKWKIPKSDADFGETFGYWGWKPSCFLMLPIFGPSNERDATGLVADYAANPINYFTPYSYYSYGVAYNNLTDGVDEFVRFDQSEKDPYSEISYAWTFVRQNQVANFQIKGNQDESSLETLQSVFFTFKDPEFPNRGKTRSVLIPTTGRKLKFTFWLQPKSAPLVYIVPGLGSHRLAETSIALAELVYKNGFSAVCLSSPYNFEFMENASTANLPAYTPVDTHDLHVALTSMDKQLQHDYPQRLGARAVMGYSMGAFESLFLAAQSETNSQENLMKFDRYVGINTPVRLLYGISKLDEYYDAPLALPASQRMDDLHNTFLKVAALSKTSLRPQSSLPFNAIESKFLIGLTFRFILRDMIYSSQQRHNEGVLDHPVTKYHRDALYDEILGYSYEDYFRKFVLPYYKTRGIDLSIPGNLEKASDLRTYTTTLQSNPNIRVIVNQNDFLLSPGDLTWLRATIPTNRITVFEKGGHLGNLSHPAVQKAIIGALADLAPADKPK